MPQIPSFPEERVGQSTPFARTGLDYLGSISIKTAGNARKVWVCLFTCVVTRAVHLEIVQGMTTSEFLLCLRRFIAQRGKPDKILSDNAPQFKMAKYTVDVFWKRVIKSKEAQSYGSGEGIKWRFTVKLAPWMGGFYERLIGEVKRSLRKTVGRKLLTYTQFLTVIKEI